MQTTSGWIVKITGTLIFGGSFIFFLRQYLDSLKKRRTGKIAFTDPIFAINLFFSLTSLAIILNIWNAPFHDFITGILVICALTSWLAWKLFQQTKTK